MSGGQNSGGGGDSMAGRRPLIVSQEKRNMLNGICDSLTHIRQAPESSNMQLRPDLSQSTPNLLDKSSVSSSSSVNGTGSKPTNTSRFAYNCNAIQEITQSLEAVKNPQQQFQISNGYHTTDHNTIIQQLIKIGYGEEISRQAVKMCGDKPSLHSAMRKIDDQAKNGFSQLGALDKSGLSGYVSKVIRKPSFEQKYSSSVNSDTSSIRSDSPGLAAMNHQQPQHQQYMSQQQHGMFAGGGNWERQTPPPPPLPPRGVPPRQTPSPLPASSVAKSQMMKRIPVLGRGNTGPGGVNGTASNGGGPMTPQRGLSPVSSRQPPPIMLSSQQAGVRHLQLNGGGGGGGGSTNSSPAMSAASSPSYTGYPANCAPPASPTQNTFFDSPSSSHSPSPAPQAIPHLHTWEAKSPAIFKQQVVSKQVSKPVLQTATVPTPLPQPPPEPPNAGNYVSSIQAQVNGQHQQQHLVPPPYKNIQVEIIASGEHGEQPPGYYTGDGGPPLPPRGTHQINLKGVGGPGMCWPPNISIGYSQNNSQFSTTPNSTPRSQSPVQRNHSPLSIVSTTSSPSTNSDIPDRPPPPYPGLYRGGGGGGGVNPRAIPQPGGHVGLASKGAGAGAGFVEDFDCRSVTHSESSRGTTEPTEDTKSTTSEFTDSTNQSEDPLQPRSHLSPKPERKADARQKDAERQEFQVRHFSSQAYKFYMEQHIENVIKSCAERRFRQQQLEREMAKVGFSDNVQSQMCKMLHQKESNYIRLKRARMEKAMFEKIKTLGIGAFGEVALVRKKDSSHLYAMKTLRKRDVLQRNQVAHVKAERDILAEADNEWVVKLYFSFQDKDNLYFVMDYIPGGDMMSLLIKFGIFDVTLAKFYIAELVLAIDSVHKMGFIHRDIKPDNILIDKDGHIKLTDFGLCTGFRWTHNSKYYEKAGSGHGRQDSMEPDEGAWGDSCRCKEDVLKPLERRKMKHQRCQAHSLVGTPNYIAPEVLQRAGHTNCCDWWSVGVILYEMLVGQPPFNANTPIETQDKVIRWRDTLRIPHEAQLCEEAEDLILCLCCDASQRLGRNGADEIKQHSFFADMEFSTLRQQPSRYIPQIRYPTDTSNFDAIDSDKFHSDLGLTMENGKYLEHHAFYEFTFRRFFDDDNQPIAMRMNPAASSSGGGGGDTNNPVYV